MQTRTSLAKWPAVSRHYSALKELFTCICHSEDKLLPAWLLGLARPLGAAGSRSSMLWLGVGALWFLSNCGLESSVLAVASCGSFLSASMLPVARAATSLSSAADEVMETRERKGAAEGCCCCWLRSDTFLESAASVELADCELKGDAKESKRTESSERPPSGGTEEEEEDEEEEEVTEDEDEEEDEEVEFLSWRTALAAAFSF